MEWYYIDKTERIGPVTEDAIAQLLAAGTLDKSSQVWNKDLPAWQSLSASSLGSLLASNSEPPPVPAAAVGNTLIWLLAFCPIIGGICTALLSPLVETPGVLFWITPALNIFCVYADENRLKKGGYDTKSMGAAWLIPWYLWKRAAVLKQSKAYFWVWCATFVVAILFLP